MCARCFRALTDLSQWPVGTQMELFGYQYFCALTLMVEAPAPTAKAGPSPDEAECEDGACAAASRAAD
jgi:hypothetical protein